MITLGAHVGRWIRSPGDRVTIATGEYADRFCMIVRDVVQRTSDYPDEHAHTYSIGLDTGEPVSVNWKQAEPLH